MEDIDDLDDPNPSLNKKILRLFPGQTSGGTATDMSDLAVLAATCAMHQCYCDETYSDCDVEQFDILEEAFNEALTLFMEKKTAEKEILKSNLSRFQWNNGTFEEGIFREDLLNGWGKITRPDGTVLEGNFVEGELSGVGKICWKEGIIEEGEFKDGFLHGWGKIIHVDGTVIEGHFKQGIYQARHYFMHLKAE